MLFDCDVEHDQLVAEAFQYCDSCQGGTAEPPGASRRVVRTLLKRRGLIVDGDDAGIDEFLRRVPRSGNASPGPVNRACV